MAIVNRVRIIIEIGCLLRTSEAYTTPLRNQRGLSFTAFHDDLQNLARSVVGLDARCETRIDLLHRNVELVRERADQGSLHAPFQCVELVQVIRQLVILGQTAELLLVVSDDGKSEERRVGK